MIAEQIRRILTDVVTRYAVDPWAWPRERDLVSDLVHLLRDAFPPSIVPATLALPSGLVDVGGSRRTSPRVRTEVRLDAGTRGQGAPPEGEAHDVQSPRQDHGTKVDLAVLKDATVEMTLHGNGARDVVLECRTSDIAALVEVKLNPDRYFLKNKKMSPWLEDVLKLLAIRVDVPRFVLALDTTLPLQAVGVTWTARHRDIRVEPRPDLPSWPLTACSFEVRKTGNGPSRMLSFRPCDAANGTGVYLCALALRHSSTWRAVADPVSRRIPLVPTADLVATCWEATVTPVDGDHDVSG